MRGRPSPTAPKPCKLPEKNVSRNVHTSCGPPVEDVRPRAGYTWQPRDSMTPAGHASCVEPASPGRKWRTPLSAWYSDVLAPTERPESFMNVSGVRMPTGISPSCTSA